MGILCSRGLVGGRGIAYMYVCMYVCMVYCEHIIIRYRLKACEQRRSELFEKQGRGQRFTTMKERDTWIKSVCFSYFAYLVIILWLIL